MAHGFLDDVAPARQSVPLLPRCGLCRLHLSCRSPFMKPFGEGRRKVLIVDEWPDGVDDRMDEPFSGRDGWKLREALGKVGVDLERDCWVTHALVCHPNGKPDPKAVEWCRPNLVKAVNDLKPETVIPLGAVAVKSLLGWVWKPDPGGIGTWAGWKVPCQQLNAWVCPTYYPSFLNRSEGKANKKESEEAQLHQLFFERHLKEAFELNGRPWKKVPDWKHKVTIELDEDRAANAVEGMIGDEPIAFDYETTHRLSVCRGSEVYSCSLSDGRTAVSFPWTGKVKKKVRDFLRSKTPKVGWNISFEESYTHREFGHGVRNWIWDGMLAAHVLDNRPDVTSLAFQSFAVLGHAEFKDATDVYLKSGTPNGENRIRQAPLDKLLLRGGLDSLLEHKIFQRQAKQLGCEF